MMLVATGVANLSWPTTEINRLQFRQPQIYPWIVIRFPSQIISTYSSIELFLWIPILETQPLGKS